MNCFVFVLPYDLFDFGSLSLVVDVDDPYGFRLLVMGRSSPDVYVVSAKFGLLLDMYEQLADFPFMLQVFDQNLACWPTNDFFQSKLFDPGISKHLLDANRLIDSRLRVYFVHNAADIVMKNAFEFNLYKAEKDKIYGLIVTQVDVYGLMGYMQQQSAEKEVEKNVFVVFYSGERAQSTILKICDAFGANRYSFSDDLSKQFQMMTEVSGRLSELITTVEIGLAHRTNLLQTIGFQFQKWNLLVKKEKPIYHTLHMLNMDVTRKCLVVEGWCPVFSTDQIQNALRQAALESSSQIGTLFQVLQTKDSPPTYFRTNNFTSAFQELVDAYGIAKYQEANPGVHTIITFPFLFAVMFGDWGHGICLLAAALYLIAREKKLSSQKLGDIMEMTFGGRNVIMMMAIFSIDTRLIHNGFFSVPFALFGPSAYSCRDLSCRDASTAGIIKMKMSILLGVTQMNLGIIISYFNAKFFGDELNIWYQFVPQIIFLNSLFGYLSILIFVKWCTGFEQDKCVVSALIDMYGKCGGTMEMSKVFDEMDEKDIGSCHAFESTQKREKSRWLFSRKIVQVQRCAAKTTTTNNTSPTDANLGEEQAHAIAVAATAASEAVAVTFQAEVQIISEQWAAVVIHTGFRGYLHATFVMTQWLIPWDWYYSLAFNLANKVVLKGGVML